MDQRVFLVLENDDSFLGKELIMEMYSQTDALIRRAVSSQSDVAAFCGIAEFPALILISNGNLIKLKLNGTDLKSYMATVLDSNLLLKDHVQNVAADKDDTHPKVLFKTQNKKLVLKANKNGHHQVKDQRKPVHSIKPLVYSEDLVATLIFSFRHEIPLHDLSGKNFRTLTRFVEVLSSCLPVPISTRRFLDQLSNRLKLINLKSKKIDVKTWMRLTSSDNPDSSLPADEKWVACQGSQPQYRGYPCGLWTVFHTVVINCARYDINLQKTCGKWQWQLPQVTSSHVVPGSKRMDIKDILYAIRDYIRDYFGCRQCSENFSKMAVEIPKEVSTALDGVLWLWRAHNHANKRLQDAVSSDPEHPKVQFPSQEQCPHCWSTKIKTTKEIQWDENVVLCFLIDMYRFESIRTTHQVYRKVVTHGQRIWHRTANRRVQDPNIHTPLSYGIDWKFSLFLYFISMVVLVFVGRTLMRSRSCRRRRTRFNPV
jgi:thiol oxidase